MLMPAGNGSYGFRKEHQTVQERKKQESCVIDVIRSQK